MNQVVGICAIQKKFNTRQYLKIYKNHVLAGSNSKSSNVTNQCLLQLAVMLSLHLGQQFTRDQGFGPTLAQLGAAVTSGVWSTFGVAIPMTASVLNHPLHGRFCSEYLKLSYSTHN